MKRIITCLLIMLIIFTCIYCNISYSSDTNHIINQENSTIEGFNTNVEAEDNSTNTDKKDANLKELRLDVQGITPSFEPETYEYYLTVPGYVRNINVTAIGQNENAKINITGNTNLKTGLNIINIQVLSNDDKIEKVYTIEVTKTNNEETANTNLEILAIEDVLLNPPFDPDETNYTIEVPENTESLNVFAVPEDENAKVEIKGADNIQNDENMLEVIVTAENGFTTKKYQIEINKEISNNDLDGEQNNIGYEAERTSTKNGDMNNRIDNVGLVITISLILIVVTIGGSVHYLRRKK